jgi:hypothetical protein
MQEINMEEPHSNGMNSHNMHRRPTRFLKHYQIELKAMETKQKGQRLLYFQNSLGW